jgi:hypothetical protein
VNIRPPLRPLGTLDADRPCTRCGYNLKGLAPGGRCPECGSPIRAKISSSEIAPAVLEAPISQLLTLAYGCYGLIIAIGLLFVVRVALGIGRAAPIWVASLVACVELVFIAAVALATIPRPGGVRGEVAGAIDLCWRWGARLLSVCGLLSTLAIIAASVGGAGTTNWSALAAWLGWGARLGAIPLALSLSGLATSLANESLAWRLRSIVALFVVSALLHLAAAWMAGAGPVGVGGWIFDAIGFVAWLFGWGVLLLGAAEIASAMQWAIRYTEESAAKEQRRVEREQREVQRAPLPVSSPIAPSRHGPGRVPDDLPIPLADE